MAITETVEECEHVEGHDGDRILEKSLGLRA
jgi:hypothetical protein